MKDSIIVNVFELRSLLQDIRRDSMEYVRLSISEEDEYDGEIIPASLDVSAYRKNGSPDAWVDYDGPEAVPDEKELEENFLYVMHMSNNML